MIQSHGYALLLDPRPSPPRPIPRPLAKGSRQSCRLLHQTPLSIPPPTETQSIPPRVTHISSLCTCCSCSLPPPPVHFYTPTTRLISHSSGISEIKTARTHHDKKFFHMCCKGVLISAVCPSIRPISLQHIFHIHRRHQTEHQCHHDIQVYIRTLFGLTADRFYCLLIVAYATLSNDHSYLQNLA